MSSHHIVRDAQEPALLLLEPDACPWSFVEELLEWSPTVLVPVAQVAAIEAKGIKVDVLLQESWDEPLSESWLAFQSPLEIVTVKDNLLKTATDYLSTKGHQTLSVVAYPEDDLQALGNAEAMELIFYHGSFKTYQVHASIWRKWLSAQTCIQFHGSVSHLKNLKPLADEKKYQVEQDGWAAASFSQKPYWISEKIF